MNIWEKTDEEILDLGDAGRREAIVKYKIELNGRNVTVISVLVLDWEKHITMSDEWVASFVKEKEYDLFCEREQAELRRAEQEMDYHKEQGA